MNLNYLDFDYSEDADGNGSFEAMASAALQNREAMLAEVARVLQWANTEFPNAQGPLDEGGEWDYELTAVEEVSAPVEVRVDLGAGRVEVGPAVAREAVTRLTVTLVVSGTAGFCEGLHRQMTLI